MIRLSRVGPSGVVLLILLLLPLPKMWADDGTKTMQAALKMQGYYYGSPSGTLDADTRSALRRFQIHGGLPVNGEPDAGTLKALGTTAKAPVGEPASAPSLPPSAGRGESAGPPKASDREFLQQLNEQTSIPREVVRPTPAPVVLQPVPSPRATPTPRRASTTPGSLPSGPAIPSASTGSRTNPQGEAAAFVKDYLAAGASPDVSAEVSQYGDIVDYFNNGRVNREFIRRDTTNYRHRWPKRDYQLEGRPNVLKTSLDGSAATVRFRLRYLASSGGQSVTGRTESTMELRRAGDGRLRIVSIKETHLR